MNFQFPNNLLLFFTTIWLVPYGIFAQPNNSVETRINVVSANIRVALKSDEEKGHGWDSRKELTFEVIREQNPDIICLQEVLRVQNEDFKEAFPDFFSFGFEGPEMDAFDDDEYHFIAKNPILFNINKFDFISGGTYWLSETPHIGGSKGWGAARARNVNWVRLKEKSSQKVFRILNTHFDHISEDARLKEAEMIIDETNQYPTRFPQILTGDFNAEFNSAPINFLKTAWTDSYFNVHGKDSGFTSHGFKGENSDSKKGRIDFIFFRGPIKASSAKVIKDNRSGFYPSDHYFIKSEMILE